MIEKVAVLTAVCFLLAASPQAASDNSSQGLLLVANKADHTLGIVDPRLGKQIAAVEVGGVTGHEVAASADGKLAFVPIYGDSGVGKPGSDGRSLAVIDIDARTVLRKLDLGRPVRPHEAILEPKRGLLYLTTELTRSVDVIDPVTFRILDTVPTGQDESHMLAVSRDGRLGYTANVGPGTVSVLDLEERKTLAVIPVSELIQRIALSTDDRLAFTADQKNPRLAVIEAAGRSVRNWIPLPAIAYGTAPTPDGRYLLITQPDTDEVAVLELASMKISRQIQVGKYPQEIVVRPDNRVAYVSCMHSGQVAVLNLETWTLEQLIEVGGEPDGLAWAARDKY